VSRSGILNVGQGSALRFVKHTAALGQMQVARERLRRESRAEIGFQAAPP